jgi:hypothetical protein
MFSPDSETLYLDLFSVKRRLGQAQIPEAIQAHSERAADEILEAEWGGAKASFLKETHPHVYQSLVEYIQQDVPWSTSRVLPLAPTLSLAV